MRHVSCPSKVKCKREIHAKTKKALHHHLSAAVAEAAHRSLFIIYSVWVQLFNNTANNREGFVVREKQRVHSLSSVRERVAFFCRLQLFMLMSKGFEKRTRFLNAAACIFSTPTHNPEQINVGACFAYPTRASSSWAEIKPAKHEAVDWRNIFNILLFRWACDFEPKCIIN